MYSSAFCSVGLQVYNLISPNLLLDGAYLIFCFCFIETSVLTWSYKYSWFTRFIGCLPLEKSIIN
jgi:hypothetical protein